MISIIVPVYNTGSYLNKCIESILNQSFQDLEIIIVDDGSDIETAIICDKLALKDTRVIVVHQKNGGVSKARNTGLELAKGEYIGYVDSDDWIETGMYESLYNNATKTNSDIVFCDAITVWSNGKRELDTINSLPKTCILTKQDISPNILLELAGATWRGLYKRDLIQDYNIRFPEGLKFSEDRIFNMIAIGCSTKINYFKTSLYHRYMREGSCVMSYHPDFTDITLKVNDVMKFVIAKYWDERYEHPFEYRNLRSVGYNAVNIFNINSLSLKNKNQAIREILNNKILHKILEKYDSLNLSLKCIKKRNILGIYSLSLIEKTKQQIKSFRFNLIH